MTMQDYVAVSLLWGLAGVLTIAAVILLSKNRPR